MDLSQDLIPDHERRLSMALWDRSIDLTTSIFSLNGNLLGIIKPAPYIREGYAADDIEWYM